MYLLINKMAGTSKEVDFLIHIVWSCLLSTSIAGLTSSFKPTRPLSLIMSLVPLISVLLNVSGNATELVKSMDRVGLVLASVMLPVGIIGFVMDIGRDGRQKAPELKKGYIKIVGKEE